MEEYTRVRIGGNSGIVIVSNGSGNGANIVLTTFPGRDQILIRKIGVMGGRSGPSRVGPRNKVVDRRTPIRMSGIVPISPGSNRPAHMNCGAISNGGMHITAGSNRILSG